MLRKQALTDQSVTVLPLTCRWSYYSRSHASYTQFGGKLFLVLHKKMGFCLLIISTGEWRSKLLSFTGSAREDMRTPPAQYT